MEFKRTQTHGHFGVGFSVIQGSLEWGERSKLLKFKYAPSQQINVEATELVTEIYDRIQAKGRSCHLRVLISLPLSRSQADALNDQRVTIAILVSSAVGAAPMRAHPIAGMAVGAATRKWVLHELRTYHAGDIIVSVDAQVSGGIGPQHSAKSILIKTS